LAGQDAYLTLLSLGFVVPPLRSSLLFFAAMAAWGQNSGLIPILNQELQRNFTILQQKADPPPYFLGYSVVDEETDGVEASMGSLTETTHSHQRYLDVTVRVGTHHLDNYHSINGDHPRFGSATLIPIDDVPNAIKRLVWQATDHTYRAAAQRLLQIKTNQQITLSEDKSDDFSEEEPSVYIENPPHYEFPAVEWAERARKLSAEFANYPEILNSQVLVVAQREIKYLVTSEGTKIEQGRTTAQIIINAQAKAPDGMDLQLGDNFETDDPAKLPKDSEIRASIQKVAKNLTALIHAPVVDPYVGPAILSGYASGVFFHEIFGHRVEGQRLKDENDGQTFLKKINQPVLPDFLSVIFDPTRKYIDGTFLNGSYAYDDQGVKARPVTVVDRGILKTFLMSRSPIQGFPHSNGHGRRQVGHEMGSRQSNLIVESTKTVSDAQLKEMLRDELKKENKPWGLYFAKVTGGYTLTSRNSLQAYTVIPLLVYRVYADGRPDELVRGVDIVGTPLTSFSKIVATSDKSEVFNGICGAESGNVPVSAVAPAMLISEIEIQRKPHSQEGPPFLPRPPTEGEGQ
jgi:TldD protein